MEIAKLKKKAMNSLPEMYMMGSFYITMANIFTVMITINFFYALLIQDHQIIFDNLINLVLPFYVMFLLALEVTQHFMNISGLVGDTITLLYTFDYELERYNYNEITPYSCPFSISEIIFMIRFGDESDNE